MNQSNNRKKQTNIIGKSLPQNINAEAAVISAMLIDSNAVAVVLEKLNEEDFYKTAHKEVFRAIKYLFHNTIEIDLITVIDQLNQHGRLEDVGGSVYLNELSDVVVSAANVEYHIDLILKEAVKRELIQAANEIIQMCYLGEEDLKDILDVSEQKIFSIAENPQGQGFVQVNQILTSTLDTINEIATTKTAVQGVRTGFTDLDKKLGGFKPGQLIVLAARPAMGKTSFALNIALHAATHQELKVGIFTMEMESNEILLRVLSAASEVKMEILQRGYGMDEQKLQRITQVAEVLHDKDLYIDDMASNTMFDIRAKTRRLKAKLGDLHLIIIDYLQLMSLGVKIDSRQQEIAEISRSLKLLAKELKVPIIALSQLNRGLENRDDKRPKLSDLRESGAIEQDADLVLFIYRDDYYYKEKSQKPNISDIIIGKNRHGPTDSVELRFEKEYTAFKSISYDEEF